MFDTRHLAKSFVCVLFATVLIGCGGGAEPHYVVTGTVVDDGKPYVIPEDQYEEGGSCVELEFLAVDESGALAEGEAAYYTYVKQDGSFVIDGTDGSGVPAGKYRAVVRRKGETDNEHGDLWGGKFEFDKSPFEFDIQSDQQITIDIATSPTSVD